MKILIATGIFPPGIGGPATYAYHLHEEFRGLGHEVKIATYGVERNLPTGLRHLVYLLKSLPDIIWAERILVLDTFSVGIPVILATRIFRRPYAVRIGGDFAWEAYVERTKEMIPLPHFYNDKFLSSFTLKERIIFKLTKFFLSRASRVIFTTPWLKDIWLPVYKIDPDKCAIVENTLEQRHFEEASGRTFLWAGRQKFLKNIALLKEAFGLASREAGDIELECVQLHKEELKKKMALCYAIILPSLSEVSPNFIHDAVSCGKPFIVTKYSGLSEDVQKLGLLVDPLSVEDLKDKIIKLSDPATYDKMRENIRLFSRVRPWSQVAEDFLKELQNSK